MLIAPCGATYDSWGRQFSQRTLEDHIATCNFCANVVNQSWNPTMNVYKKDLFPKETKKGR